MLHGAITLLLAALGVALGFSPTLSSHGVRAAQPPQLSLVASLAPAAEKAAVDAPPVPAPVQLRPMRGEAAPSESPLLDHFVDLFAGHFDNIAQVTRERAAGLTPREGGGHEQIHCWLQPISLPRPLPTPTSLPTMVQPYPQRLVLATYYFDGQPERTFRVRLYALADAPADAPPGSCVQMSIYRMREGLEEELKECAGVAASVGWSESDLAPELRIPDCDIFWKWDADAFDASGANGGRFEGEMLTRSIRVFSPVLQKPIVVRDDVTLSCGMLSCNDRGHDEEGAFVYGNYLGVPYHMDRVEDGHWTTVIGASNPDVFDSSEE